MPDAANEPTIWLSEYTRHRATTTALSDSYGYNAGRFRCCSSVRDGAVAGKCRIHSYCSGNSFYSRSDHRGFDIHYALRRSLSRAVGPCKRLSFQRDFYHSTYFDFSECLCARRPSRPCASNHRMAICHLAFRFPSICDRLCRPERQNRFGKKAANFRSLRHYLQRRDSYCFGLRNHLGLAGSRRQVAAPLFDRTTFAPLVLYVGLFDALVCGIALFLLWVRQRSVLDQWLMIAIFATLLEMAMSTFLCGSL